MEWKHPDREMPLPYHIVLVYWKRDNGEIELDLAYRNQEQQWRKADGGGLLEWPLLWASIYLPDMRAESNIEGA